MVLCSPGSPVPLSSVLCVPLAFVLERPSISLGKLLSLPLAHADLALHLLRPAHTLAVAATVESQIHPVLPGIDVLPTQLIVSARQDILVHSGWSTQHRGPEGIARPHHMQLHPATQGFREPKVPAQQVHLCAFLRGGPVLQAGLERMRRCDGGCG